MLSTAFLALLLQAASPEAIAKELPAGHLRSYVTASDYPKNALAKGEQGSVRFAVVVGTDGRVKDCSILKSSGSLALDSRTCEIMQERLRFRPARDAQGQLIEDVYSGVLDWRLSE